MKFCKKFRAILLALLVLLLLPQPALAADSVDLTKPVTLTITAQYGGAALPGVRFELYLVSVMDETGALTPTEAFSPFEEDLSSAGQDASVWRTLAERIERALLLGTLGTVRPADAAETDADGIARFPSGTTRLTPGLYLVPGTHMAKNGHVYRTAPFLVLLPEWDAQTDVWRYEVTARAKPDEEPEQTDLKVIKVWQDDCHAGERPESITIQLMQDGSAYGEPVVLRSENAWRYTWYGLPANHTWTVTETVVSGYREPDIRREGNTFIVTNVCDKTTPETPDAPSLPQTGLLWWPVPLLLIAGALLLLAAKRTKKQS